MKVTVNNLPDYELSKYIVARYYSQSLWFYGTFDDLEIAQAVAEELGNGLVVENDESVGRWIESEMMVDGIDGIGVKGVTCSEGIC